MLGAGGGVISILPPTANKEHATQYKPICALLYLMFEVFSYCEQHLALKLYLC